MIEKHSIAGYARDVEPLHYILPIHNLKANSSNNDDCLRLSVTQQRAL